MKKILILSLLIIISMNSYSGWKSKLILGGGFIVLQKSVPILLRKGGPIAMNKSKSMIKKYLTKNPQHIALVTGYLTSLAIENSGITTKTTELLIDTGLIDSREKRKIEESGKDYDKAYAMAISNIEDINEDRECRNGKTYYEFGYSNLTNFMSNSKKPVKLYDVGSFKNLQHSQLSYDEMQHDHIPSNKAVIMYIQNKLGEKFKAKSESGKNLFKNSTSIEIGDNLHKAGRTFAGKNTKFQYTKDSKNLKIATLKDMAYHLIHSDFDINLLDPFKKIYKRNASLCLYK